MAQERTSGRAGRDGGGRRKAAARCKVGGRRKAAGARCGADGNGVGLRLYAREVRRLAPPPPREVRRLFARLHHGDLHALDEVVLRHLGLVVDAVESRRVSGKQFPRLIEAGNLALVRAVLRFRPGRDGEFAAYAMVCVRRVLARRAAST